MVNQVLEQRLGFAAWKLGRLTQLLLLAVSVLVYSVMSITAANSLFVSHVGAANLPIAFIWIGLFSMPAYAVFSNVVDRYSRPQLFRAALFIQIVIILGLRLLLAVDTPYAYYVVLIVCFFQWDFHNNILYASLLTDYLTTLEYKRAAPYVGIAQAVGVLLGGSITAVCSQFLSTPNLLVCVPLVFGLVIAQLVYLEATQQRLDTVKPPEHVGIFEALQSFPELVKRYPLVLLLAASSFLLVIIYLSSEFLWFSIYARYFTDETLTGFLGFMRMSVSILQVLVLYCFTRPLLHWLGVARMNIVYPLTTLASFIGVVLHVNLGTAIALQLNGDSLYKSINLPTHQLNYNAIPREFLGRVRTLSDGLIYAVGLTLAGLVLLVERSFLNLTQIAYFAIALTVLFLLIRLPMGKFYTTGLEAMIRADTIDLDDFDPDQVQLPLQSTTLICDFLRDGDRYTQIRGLELATSLGHPGQFLTAVQPLLATPYPDVRRAVVRLFSTQAEPETLQFFHGLLQVNTATLPAIALEILIINRYPFTPSELQILRGHSQAEIRALAHVAAIQLALVESPQLGVVCPPIGQIQTDETAAAAIVNVIATSRDRALLPLLIWLLPQGSATLKQEVLTALTTLAQPGDRALAEVAIGELHHPEPMVRAKAFEVLGHVYWDETLDPVATGLHDADPRVRQTAATALIAFGQAGLLVAQAHLNSPQPETVEAAIAAIGQVRTNYASNLLFNHLLPDFQTVNQTRKWQQQIPQQDPRWQPLQWAIADYHQRVIQKVLYVLSCMGHSRTVNTVNRILYTTDQQDLANAVEVLASLSDRRFVLPLMPVLEQLATRSDAATRPEADAHWLRTKGYKLLLETLTIQDRWIQIGALAALASIPTALLHDPDPVVQRFVQQIFPANDPSTSPTTACMNRLLLLKQVALFKNLSLDQLLLIDQAIEQETVLAGTIIFAEGSWCTHFYIIADGCVRIVKTLDGQQRELKQLTVGHHFGEIALFDDAPHWDGAIALQDTTLLKLDKNRFLNLITQRPHIMLEICRFLSQRVRETDHYHSTVQLTSPLPEE